MKDMFTKKRWLRDITASLKQIASEEFQEKGWILGEIHDYCRFDSTICGLYECCYFEEFIDNYAKKFGVTNQQIQKLDQLRRFLNAYLDKHGCYEEPEIILEDPEWHKIRQLAKECLEILHVGKYLDPSKDLPKYSLLFAIHEFSSPELQKRIWIEERKPGRNPFQEWVDKFFNSYVCKTREIIEHYHDYEITDEQRQFLIKFYDILKSYWEKMKDEKNLQKILDDPEWHKIQSLAQQVINIFHWKAVEED